MQQSSHNKATGIIFLALFLQGGCIQTQSLRQKRQRLASYKHSHYEALPESAIGSRGYQDVFSPGRKSRLILLGDQHSDVVLHRRLLHILQLAKSSQKKITLVCEFIGQQDEKLMDDFLAGRLSLVKLRKKIKQRWPQSWMDLDEFDSAFYIDLVLLARRESFSIRALEPTPRHPLLKRDRVMAATIARLFREQPDSLLVVLVGHTHLLGRGHLTERLERFRPLVIVPKPSPRLAKSLQAHERKSPDRQRPAFWVLSASLWLLDPASTHGKAQDRGPPD